MAPNRIALVNLSGIKSSYPLKNTTKLDVSALKVAAQCAPDMRDALLKLKVEVEAQGGDLQITDLFRPWDVQAQLRAQYEKSIKDPTIVDKAFAAPPGGSFHQAGRAVDLNIGALKFKGLADDKHLDKLWEICKPLGFHPIIKIPDEGMSECWHFDFPGPWEKAYDKLSYSEVAKCAILDIGCWGSEDLTLEGKFIQAQLIRLGFYEIGVVDGIIGSKTKNVLKQMGLDKASSAVVCKALADRK